MSTASYHCFDEPTQATTRKAHLIGESRFLTNVAIFGIRQLATNESYAEQHRRIGSACL